MDNHEERGRAGCWHGKGSLTGPRLERRLGELEEGILSLTRLPQGACFESMRGEKGEVEERVVSDAPGKDCCTWLYQEE